MRGCCGHAEYAPAYVHVPIICGTNTDEGTSFGPMGVNTSEQFLQILEGKCG